MTLTHLDMPLGAATTGLPHARALLDRITAAGGTVPDRLVSLLNVVDQLNAEPADADALDGLIDQLADGKLSAKALDAAIAKAAAAESARTYRDNLRRKSASAVVRRFHVELESGAVDEVLTSLRPVVAEHAKALADASALISEFDTADQLIRGGSPEQITAWTSLDQHIEALQRVAAVVETFGPTGDFALIGNPTHLLYGVTFASYTAGGIFLANDTVPLVTASATLRTPGSHRDSSGARTGCAGPATSGAERRVCSTSHPILLGLRPGHCSRRTSECRCRSMLFVLFVVRDSSGYSGHDDAHEGRRQDDELGEHRCAPSVLVCPRRPRCGGPTARLLALDTGAREHGGD